MYLLEQHNVFMLFEQLPAETLQFIVSNCTSPELVSLALVNWFFQTFLIYCVIKIHARHLTVASNAWLHFQTYQTKHLFFLYCTSRIFSCHLANQLKLALVNLTGLESLNLCFSKPCKVIVCGGLVYIYLFCIMLLNCSWAHLVHVSLKVTSIPPVWQCYVSLQPIFQPGHRMKLLFAGSRCWLFIILLILYHRAHWLLVNDLFRPCPQMTLCLFSKYYFT